MMSNNFKRNNIKTEPKKQKIIAHHVNNETMSKGCESKNESRISNFRILIENLKIIKHSIKKDNET